MLFFVFVSTSISSLGLFSIFVSLFRHRPQIQERCIQRPSVGQSKSLLKAKILGSIGGGPFELLRAFRKMHCGRGTVRRSRERRSRSGGNFPAFASIRVALFQGEGGGGNCPLLECQSGILGSRMPSCGIVRCCRTKSATKLGLPVNRSAAVV